MRLILAMAMAAAVSAQDEDPVAVLMRLRDRILEQRASMPNHTCVETIARDRYEPRTGRMHASCDAVLGRRKKVGAQTRLRLETTDRLRLDVGLASDHEMYSWPGARRFSETEIYDFTPAGAIGTGPFATLLFSLFESAVPEITFDGETVQDVQRLYEYSFTKPQPESQYRIHAGAEWLITGYTATMFVDPRTSDLVRVVVRTEELPPATGMCELDTTLDYGSVPLSGVNYLVPVAARQQFVLTDGGEAENRVSYASCRDFRGESKVQFGLIPVQQDLKLEPVPLRVAAGTPVAVEIVHQIDCESAAAGDLVEGRLAKAIGGIPAGARLEGRLLQVRKRYSDPLEASLALRWETIQRGGVQIPIHLAPKRRPGETIEIPLQNENDYDVYHFRGKRALVPSGYRTEWVTVQP